MALYQYFKANSDAKLPDLWGPLLREVPLTSTASANGKVRRVLQLQQTKRGPYMKFTPEQKAEIGKRAAKHGIAATIRYYKNNLLLSRKAAFTPEGMLTLQKSGRGSEKEVRTSM